MPKVSISKGYKSDRVKQSTRRYRKRRPFNKKKREEAVDNVNNVDIEFVNTNNEANNQQSPSTVNNVDIQPLATPTRTASSKKVEPIISQTPKETDPVSGYRFVDMEILSSVFAEVSSCPVCLKPGLSLCDRVSKKKGFSSLLYLKCTSLSCQYMKEFYTSDQSTRSFDVNKRLIYTMRTLGHGHKGITKFASLMNMPRPMTFKNYDSLKQKIAIP